MKDEEFDRFIARCIEEQRSGKYNIVFEEWLISMRDLDIQWPEDDKNHVKTRTFQRVNDYENDPYYISLEIDQEDEYLVSAGTPLTPSGISLPRPEVELKVTKPERSSVRLTWYLIAIAATILLLAVFLFGNVDSDIEITDAGKNIAQASDSESQAASLPGITKTLLPDGTIVWLKGDSKVEPKTFNKTKRVVSLEGEAFFEVAKNSDRPFIIQIGDMSTRVLGTSFNIDATESTIKVAVLTGKVGMTSTYDSEGIVVEHDEKAIYDASRKEFKKTGKVTEQERAGIIANTEFDMNFDETKLVEVAKKIEKKFNIEVQLNVAKRNEINFTGNLTDVGLTETFNLVCGAIDLEYELMNDSTVVLRDREVKKRR